jgi:hypothetical protein
MSLITRLLSVIRSLRDSLVGPKTARRTHVAIEQLDDRQLLSVNFTGNVVTDFPPTKQPGVVFFPFNTPIVGTVTHPNLPSNLQPIIKVSGFDISGIAVSYDSTDDTLSIGLDQPPSQNHAGEVISGDADNNGDRGTVNPAVTAVAPGFLDFFDLQGPAGMGAFLDLRRTGFADVVAGFAPSGTVGPKDYQVAQAIVNPPSQFPFFGTPLPQFTGNVYLNNSILHPNLEFSIAHFSQLYASQTGQTLTPQSVIGIGAFGVASYNIGVSDAFFPEQTFTLAEATVPPPLTPSPPVTINPHSHRHVNTTHPTLVRATVLGTSGFDVTQIIPSSVTLGGAHPVFSFTKFVNRDEFLDETFVFKGTDITQLPAGFNEATVTGTLKNGQTFSTSALIFNRDPSFSSEAQLSQQQARWTARGGDRPFLSQRISNLESRPRTNVTYTSPASGQAASAQATPAVQLSAPVSTQSTSTPQAQTPQGPAASFRRKPTITINRSQGPRLPNRLQASMNAFINQAGSAK